MNIDVFQNMPDWQVVYVLTTVIAVLVLATLSAFAWRFRYTELGKPVLLMCVSGLCWSVLVFFQAIFPPEVGRLWLNLRHIFAASCPITLIWCVLQITGLMPQRRRRWLLLSAVIPTIGLLLLWTQPKHGLMINEVSFSRLENLTTVDYISFGPYYWLFVAQGYLLTAASFVLLLTSSLHGTPLLRNQSLPIAIGIAAPILANFLLLTQIVSRAYDPMPHAMAFMATMVWWATLRHKMLDLIPLARNVLVDAMIDSVLAVDGKGRIIDINHAMSGLIGLPSAATLGRPLAQLPIYCEYHARPEAARMLLSDLMLKPESFDKSTPIRMQDRWFVPRIVILPSRKDEAAGRLLVLHDITERMQMESEREASMIALQDALDQVRTLRGLLPMCSACKKIKDKIGRWHPVEEFIQNNSEADLSHGVCPDCQSNLYANYLPYRDAASPASQDR